MTKQPNKDEAGIIWREDMKPLDTHWTHWIPLWSSVLGVTFVVGMYAMVVTNTNVMAKESAYKIDVNELASRERDEKLTSRATANETRIVRLEECVLGIKGQLEDIKQQNIRILNKIDGAIR